MEAFTEGTDGETGRKIRFNKEREKIKNGREYLYLELMFFSFGQQLFEGSANRDVGICLRISLIFITLNCSLIICKINFVC